jgi:hypothetical protein
MKTLEKLNAFAKKHEVTLIEKGECGFGRPCVGFTSESGNYVDYNPIRMHGDYDYILEYDDKLEPPDNIDAYHKHECFAVLVSHDNYATALGELLEWVEHLDSQGSLYLSPYSTGATGMQAMISGATGWAFRFEEDDLKLPVKFV